MSKRVRVEGSVRCDGPGCEVVAVWQDDKDTSNGRSCEQDYWRLERVGAQLHFCTLACLARWVREAPHEVSDEYPAVAVGLHEAAKAWDRRQAERYIAEKAEWERERAQRGE